MEKEITRTGFYASLAALIAAVGFGVVQVLQLMGTTIYPVDEILIYSFSLAIAPPFLIAILAVYYLSPRERKFCNHAALLFALMYTIYAVLVYTVQLASVIPFPLRDGSDNIFSVKPHSLFWTIDALAYMCMGLSTLFAGFAFRENANEKLLGKFLIANGLVVPLISVVYFYPHFSENLLLLGSPWLLTAGGSLLLMTRFFKRGLNQKTPRFL